MRRLSLLVVFYAGLFLGGCQNIIEGLKEQVYVYVSGQVAAAMTEEATLAIQERLLESLTGVDAEYQGDGTWVLVPLEGQPPLGSNVATGPTEGSYTLKSFRAMATGATSKTGYSRTEGPGPDGYIGWYETRSNGLIFYYKTIPVSDLSQAWPSQVQVLYSGWKADANHANMRGYSWWMKNAILSSTHVKGEWHFDIAADAPKYGGTSYSGTYDYEQEKGVKAIIGVTGAMRLQYAGGKREAYTSYAYAFTNQTGIESGRFYYGVGPEKSFVERPEWAQSVNPAGPEWTDTHDRPGLSYFKVWVDKAYSWWRYDGTSQSCSSEASAIAVSGSGVVTAGKTIQLNAVATNNCTDILRYRTFEWSSSLPDIATVNSSGLITARSVGETVISVKSGAVVKTVNISVREFDIKPAYITISGGSNVQVGSTFTLAAVVYNKNNEALEAAAAWSASSGNASVSSTGIVTGLAAGSVSITARSGDVSAVRAVQVFDPNVVNSVAIFCARNNVVVSSNTSQCSATLRNYAGTSIAGSVTWGSTNVAVLTVDSSGLVTPVASGSALVSATSSNGKTATYNMVVNSQNDISHIVIASANGASLRIGESDFKLSLQARAYNYNGDEIEGLSFSWSIYDYPSRASVVAQSPSSLAQASVGTQEGTVTIRAQAGSVIGSFQAGAWDNRIATINITNEPSYTLAENSTYQLYVQARNVNSRSLGFITPTWSSTGSLTITAGGLMTASGVGVGSVTATIAKGDGSGDTSDTVNHNIIDPALVTSVQLNSCTVSTIYTGNTFNCSATPKNGLNLTVAGATVTWTTTNDVWADLTSTDNTVSPNRGYFVAPSGIVTGGSVQIRAYVGAVQSGVITINVKGSGDINYISVNNPGASTYPIPTIVALTATAYDYQAVPQAIVGVSFTWSKSGSGYSDPSTNAGVVVATSVNSGNPTYFYASAGGKTSNGYGLYSTDPDQAYYVDVYRSNAATNFNIGDSFTVWARAFRNVARTDEVLGKTFTFTPNTKVAFSNVDSTSATATIVRCDCSVATVNTSISVGTSGPGWSQSGTTAFNINNPIWNVWITEAQNSNLAEGTGNPTYPLTVTFSSANSSILGAPSSVSYYDQGSGNFNVAAGVIQNLIFNNLSSSYSVQVYSTQTATGSQSNVVYWNFKIVPPAVDMALATTAPTGPGLSTNLTLRKQYYFFSDLEYTDALAYASLDTVGTVPEQTWTTWFTEVINNYDPTTGYSGIRKLSTGDIDINKVGVRIDGYIRFGSYSTAYAKLQGFDGARITIGGILVLDRWSNVGYTGNKSVSLTNLQPNVWYPIAVEGILRQNAFANYELMDVQWSNGGNFYDDPLSSTFSVGRD